MKKFRIHLCGLAHLPVSPTFVSCAFTQKNIKLSEMLMSLGHEVYFYGCPDPSGFRPNCTEFITTHTIEDIKADYGEGDDSPECDGIGYRWREKDGFKSDFNSAKNPSTLKFYKNTVDEINKRKKPDDFVFVAMGKYHDPIVDNVKLILRCESGIGYRGSSPKNFRAFESSYIMNFTYGSEKPFASMDGNHYDRVIPNFFYPQEFTEGKGDGGYALYLGRMIRRKGIEIAYEACKATNTKLILAGQGAVVAPNGHLRMTLEPSEFDLPPGNWEYVGVADQKKRNELYGGAIATFVPTLYLEPFGGTHIESMLCHLPGDVLSLCNKKIENCFIGDSVYSKGSVSKITNIGNRNYNGEVITIKPQMMLPITLTKDHPVLTSSVITKYFPEKRKINKPSYKRGTTPVKWKKINDITLSDYLVVPKYQTVKDVNFLDLSSYFKRDTSGNKNLYSSISVDNDFMWLLGLYLAEGSGGSNTAIGLNINEVRILKKLRNIVTTKFNHRGNVLKNHKTNSIQFRFGGRPLSEFLLETFGRRSENLDIPKWIMDLPKDKVAAFLTGYIDGDGCFTKKRCVSITTASRSLALSVQKLLTKLDILAGITHDKREGKLYIRGRLVNQKDRYLIRFNHENKFESSFKYKTPVSGNRTTKLYVEDVENFYVKVKSIVSTHYSGRVYNITTQTGEYNHNNLVVHNCGTPVLTTNFGVFSDHSTFIDGMGGYHCDTLNDFVQGLKLAPSLNRKIVRDYARRYTLGNVRWLYQKWLCDLYNVYESMMDRSKKGWSRIEENDYIWRKQLVSI